MVAAASLYGQKNNRGFGSAVIFFMLIPFTKEHPFPLHSGLLFFEDAKRPKSAQKRKQPPYL